MTRDAASGLRWPHAFQSLSGLVVLTSVAFGLVYLGVAIARIRYPYDLDFIEDAMLMQALRVAEGLPVFVLPNADFAPQAYMPLYTWLGGQLIKITGPSLLPLRLISLLSTLATALLVFGIAQREARDPVVATACAGLFLAGYRVSGGWYELARVDPLFVALALGGAAVVVYRGRRMSGALEGAVLLGLCALTKQHGLLFAAAALATLARVDRTNAWRFAIACSITTAIPVLWLHLATGGRFSAIVFVDAYADPIELWRVLATVVLEFFGSMAVLTICFGGVVLAAWRGEGWRGVVSRPWLLFAGVALLVTVGGRASVGGNRNNLMPAYAFLCLAPALLIAMTRREGSGEPRLSHRLVAVAMLLQFGLTVVNPVRSVLGFPLRIQYWPTQEMVRAGDRLIERLRRVDGDVLVLMHPYYAILAGKRPSVAISALWYNRRFGRDPMPPDFVGRLAEHQYALIVSDESQYFETDPALRALLDTYYQPAGELTAAESPESPTGMIVRPTRLYTPRDEPAMPAR